MSDSETSSDVNINYQTNDGNNLLNSLPKKPQTTDTDYYFNMIANPNKLVDESNTSETSQIVKSSSSSSSASSKKSDISKSVYDKITLSPRNTASERRNTHNTHSERNTHNTHSERPKETRYSEKPPEVIVKKLTPQEARMKKIELLRKLSELKTKGFQLTKDYDFSSSIEEMEYEYDLLKSFVDKRNGVKLFKNGIVNAAAFLEFMNDKYDPFDFHLSGWSEHMDTEVDNWEDVLGELYEKYKGSGKKTPPELKLLGLILFSASAFHFTKSQSMSVPFGNDMVRKMMAGGGKETSQFMTAQEVNLERQAEMLKRKEMESKMKAQAEQQNYIKKLEEQVRTMQQSSSEPQAVNSSIRNLSMPPQIPIDQLRPNKTPDEVKDILNRLHSYPKIDKPTDNKSSFNTETQDDTSSNNDRLLSESNVSESTPNKRGRKPKKSNISIF
jgi:hypothetical protein